MGTIGAAALPRASKLSTRVLGVGAACAVLLGAAAPAQAASSVSGAEKLRKLDIMLMVTSLRCRTTADSFSAEYGQFTSSHLAELNEASDTLRADLAQRFGSAGSARALDRISTVMANTYGQGHPWLSCRDLKMVAADLARVQGRDTLIEAADQLLGADDGAGLAYARR